MTTNQFIAVAGPSGSGKTNWISQAIQASNQPCFYLAPGVNEHSIDLMRMGYSFPDLQIVSDTDIPAYINLWRQEGLANATVYLEIGFHLVLDHPMLSVLPWHQVAVVPPQLSDSEWHRWADEIITGNDTALITEAQTPNLWLTSLKGQVFDPPSVNEILMELVAGAYGEIHRVKGIFELPDGKGFYIDFVQGMSDMGYVELKIPRWLKGRPDRPSGIEVVGWNLQSAAIAQTLKDSYLTDDLLNYYQQQYQATLEEEGLPI